MVDPTDSASDPMRSEAERDPTAATAVDGALAPLAEIRDTAARIEQDEGQRYAALQANANAFAERLTRIEAGQAQRMDGVDAVLQRLEALAGADRDALARVEADAGRRFEALMAARADMLAALGRMERLVARGGTAPAAPLPDRGTEWVDLDVTARSTAKTRPLRAIVAEAGLMHWAEIGPIRIRYDLDAASPLVAANAALADFLADRARLAAEERLLWIVPVSADEDIADPEAEQIFGLLGRTETMVRTTIGGRAMLLVAGSRRPEEILPLLRWSAQALALAAGGDLPMDALTDEVRRCLVPVFDLPGQAATGDPPVWAKRAALVMERFETGAARVHGVTVPLSALGDPACLDPWLAALRLALGAGASGPLIQWVRDPIPVARSAEVIALAARLGVAIDLTATTRDMSGAAFAAYDDRAAYRPMGFDLRLPSPAAGGLVCLARRDVAAGGTEDPYSGHAQRLAARLRRVLRRDVTDRFAQAVAAEPSLAAGQWELHHIYNWRPVSDRFAQAVVFDAELDLGDVTSSLGRAETVAGLLNAAPADPLAVAGLRRPTVDGRANIDLQVEEHRYLAEQRPEPSADSLRLASWLPETLGETLELGSGYGVLAEGFIGRASRYVGIDLTPAQGEAVRGLGGLPLIGDIHVLPLPDLRFDTVIADNVIEHATDPVGALAEMHRVLRPGGRGFLVLPLDYLGPDYRNASHHWKADVDSILAAMAAAGLEVVRHEVCILPAIGAKGSFPSCNQRTSLWEVRRPVAPAADRSIVLDFRAETRAIDPALAGLAERTSEEIVALNAASQLDGLARRSPSLRGFDWSGYIRLSELRFVRAAALLARLGGKGRRVLDLGSYFGNQSLLLARAGWQVTAIDSYAEYSPALDRHVALMRAEGVEVVDFDQIGYDLTGLKPARFDAVCCMGVIEHVPHTPRLLLEAIDRVLKPGGALVLDTPNLGYEYKRLDLAAGRTVFPPLAEQYETEIPFAGHHREYTPGEVRWLMERIGYEDIALETFSYSLYGMTTLAGEHLARFEAMAADPDRRELIIAAARKPAGQG